MERIKKILQGVKEGKGIFLLALISILFLTACGSASDAENGVGEPAVVTVIVTATPQPTPEPEVIIKEVIITATPQPTPEPEVIIKEVIITATPEPTLTPTPTLPPELEGEGEIMTYLFGDAGITVYAWYEQDTDGSMALSLMRVVMGDFDSAEVMDGIYLKRIGESLYRSEDEYYFMYMEGDRTAFYFVDCYTRHNLSGHYICESRYYSQFLDEDD